MLFASLVTSYMSISKYIYNHKHPGNKYQSQMADLMSLIWIKSLLGVIFLQHIYFTGVFLD